MKQFTLQHLAQGINQKHVGAERARLTEKWARTGLLRGLDGNKREVMSQLLENQAAQVLKESGALSNGAGSLVGSGQIQGFSNIAFPIVRRVFGGLVANELVSIQPMSLPSGLIFYLDYTYGTDVGKPTGQAGEVYSRGTSIYNSPTGKGVRSGSLATGGMYDLVGAGYSRVTGSMTALNFAAASVFSGSYKGTSGLTWTDGGRIASDTDFSGSNARNLDFDAQVETALASNDYDAFLVYVPTSAITAAIPGADLLAVEQIAVFSGYGANAVAWGETYQGGQGVLNLRRLNKRGNFATSTGFAVDALNGTHIQMVLKGANGLSVLTAATGHLSCAVSTGLSVDGDSGATVTVPSFESDFGATPAPAIPEIDIKIESIAITAETRKLRARWSPELAQDLNAYHSMDAEVELTSILSEQIALEIDRDPFFTWVR